MVLREREDSDLDIIIVLQIQRWPPLIFYYEEKKKVSLTEIVSVF